MGSHRFTVTCHLSQRWARPTLTAAKQAGTQFTYPWWMRGWVELGGWLWYREMVDCHPSMEWSRDREWNRWPVDHVINAWFPDHYATLLNIVSRRIIQVYIIYIIICLSVSCALFLHRNCQWRRSWMLWWSQSQWRKWMIIATSIQNCSVPGTGKSVSLWLTGTVRAEPETVISRACVQSPDPAE